ncbi:MAG TPA: MerR family transcriptional regulator [Thermoanaerobaculia bacterium]|jgi:antitoxin component of RelBE/YafQ-DinJ toxin-antitoxin module
MTLHVSIDEQLAQRAQQVAEGKGLSLDQLIRHYLEDLTAEPSAEEDIAELRRLSGQGSSQGWKFNRDEIHERS